MSNRSRISLIPKLRFPEFRKSEGWILKKLKDVCEVNPTNYEFPERFLYIDLESVEAGKLKSRKIISRDEAPSRAQRLLRVGDVIFQIVRPYQRNNFHFKVSDSLDYVASTGYAQLRPKDSPDFLFQAVHVDDFVNRVIAKCTGSSYPAINSSDLAEVPLATPKPEEQEKIAGCLNFLDELIAEQILKIDALKVYKNGLIQQLFPADGLVQPKTRFPGFENAGNWNVRRLDSVGRVIRGASPRPQGDPRYYGGPVPRLMVQDVTRDGKWVTPRIDLLTIEGAKLSRPCPAGTLTIVCSGTVGVVSFLAIDACIHDGFIALIDINESIATKDFLYHSLGALRLQFEEGATHGGVFTNLTTSGIQQFEIKCPSPVEQQCIAAFLSNLDTLIAAGVEKVSVLKNHKKGLTQKLFPLPEV